MTCILFFVVPAILFPGAIEDGIYWALSKLKQPGYLVMWLFFSPALLSCWLSSRYLHKNPAGHSETIKILNETKKFWSRLWKFERQKGGAVS